MSRQSGERVRRTWLTEEATMATSRTVASRCAAGVCDPERTEGLKAPAPNGTYPLVTLKGPGVFLGAEVSK